MKKHVSAPKSPELSPAWPADACRALRCPVPDKALAPLREYLTLLMHRQRGANLVGAKTHHEALLLAADSFFLARFLEELPLPPQPLTWDLGAGAGLPGIPLRMVWQAGEYYMVESREKRAVLLDTALAQLALPDTFAVHERAERFFARMIAQGRHADCILSRAFLPWRKLLPFVADALAPGGLVCIAANSPLPGELPDSWKLTAEYAYELDGAQRVFRAVAKR